MPAKSQAQRGYLASHFGVEWMRKHHFTNKGPLPEHVGKSKGTAKERRPSKKSKGLKGR